MLVDPSNPFADLVPQQGAPGVIYGPPEVPKPKEPPSGYTWGADGAALVPIPGGPADKPPGDAKAAEAERKAAYLATNLTANISLMNQALKVDPSAAKPTWGQWFSGFLGEDAKNAMLPEQRQVVENSQKLITDAALTLGTGAAYTKEQIEAYRRGFFPQVGDSDAAVAAKREALRAALVAARIAAGGQAPKIDEAMALMGMDPNAPLTVKPEEALKFAEQGAPPPIDPKGRLTDAAYAATGTGGDKALVDDSAIGVAEFTSDQKAAYEGFWKANPDPTPEQLTTFLGSIGINNVTNAADIIQKVKEGTGYSTTRLQSDYRTKVEQRVKQQDELGVGGGSDAETLFMGGASAGLRDEASGIGNVFANAIASPFTDSEFDPVTSYRLGRDAERLRIEDARQQLGYGGTAIEFAGALASFRPGAVTPVSRLDAAREAGRGGAAAGALAGFGVGEGTSESLTGAALGAGVGALAGRYGPDALALGGRLLPRRFRSPQGMDPELAAAAEAEGVDLIRPMVDPRSRAKFGALESDPTAQPIIRGGVERTRDQIEGRVGDLAPGGVSLEPGAAGERLQLAGNRYVTRSRGVANRLYDRAERLSGGTTVAPAQAVNRIDAELAELQALPNVNQGEIAFLQELREDLTRGPLTVGTLRNLRTSLRGRIGTQNLTMTQAEARAARVLDAAADDITAALPREAAAAYRRADAFYRKRQVMVDDIKRAILGKRDDPMDPQKAFANIKSLASPGGNGRRLAAVMRNLDPDERQDIAATVAQSLGRDGPDMPFSPAKFISQTSKLSPSARRTIFGPDGAESINNLRRLSQAFKEAGGDINYSRSTTVANRMSPLKVAARTFIASITGLGGAAATGGSAAGLAGGVALAAGGMAVGAGVKTLSARAMVNPRVSRWLAEAVDVSTQRQAEEATRKLGVIIGREPALARELQPIHDFLQQRLTQRLAANPEAEGEDNER